jgi:hypothetical protein
VFLATDLRPDLPQAYPNHSLTQAVYAGLTDLAGEILGRNYVREGTGEQIRVERCLVDAGWESATVYQWCRQNPFANSIYPSKGIARTATSRGVSEWKPRAGEKSGWHWRLTMSETGKGRMVQFDPDAWKSFLWERMTCKLGDATRGGLTLFGRDAAAHEMVAEHLAAEAAVPVKIRGIEFDKWAPRPNRPDNHWLDCAVGCMVAGAVQGLTWSASPLAVAEQSSEKFRLADLTAAKREAVKRREPPHTVPASALPASAGVPKKGLAELTAEKRARRNW